MIRKSGSAVLIISDQDRPGNYLEKLLKATKDNPPKPGTVNHVQIRHDDWCALLASKGPCNCDPDIEIVGQEQ